MKKILVALGAAAILAGCTSDADQASRNLSTAAEQFEVQRRIVGINGITDEPAFEVEGRCSIESGNTGVAGALEVTCKHGPEDFRKHYIGLSDNTFYVTTQLEGLDASEYRTRIIIKPETIIPDFDLETSGDLEGDG